MRVWTRLAIFNFSDVFFLVQFSMRRTPFPPKLRNRILAQCRIGGLRSSVPDHFSIYPSQLNQLGNSLLRFLLIETGQAAAHSDPDWRRRCLRLAMRRQ